MRRDLLEAFADAVFTRGDLTMPAVGAKLRELRRRRRIGTRTLALRSGVSHSTISLIERDRMSPSVDTIAAIVDALGTTLAAFFSDLPQPEPASPVYAAADLPEIGSSADVSYRMVGIDHPERRLLMLHETYAPGADSGTAFAHEAQEAGIVVRGTIELTLGARTFILQKGDGYYFDSRTPHRFRDASGEGSEIVSAVTPPTY